MVDNSNVLDALEIVKECLYDSSASLDRVVRLAQEQKYSETREFIVNALDKKFEEIQIAKNILIASLKENTEKLEEELLAKEDNI